MVFSRKRKWTQSRQYPCHLRRVAARKRRFEISCSGWATWEEQCSLLQRKKPGVLLRTKGPGKEGYEGDNDVMEQEGFLMK